MMRRRWCAALVALGLDLSGLGLARAQVDTPGADCTRRPASPVQQRVCGSPYAKLRAADRELDKWLRRALAATPQREQLYAEQQAWTRQLGSCLQPGPAEPARFVCDKVRIPARHAQCQRDFCLAGRYAERTRRLHHQATLGEPGRYVMSARWLTGVRMTTQAMRREDVALCRDVEADLAKLEPMRAPLALADSGGVPVPWTVINWQRLEASRQLAMAMELEGILRQQRGHPDGPVVGRDFADSVRTRMQAGEGVVMASTPPEDRRHGQRIAADEVVVVRYRRRVEDAATTRDRGNVVTEYFRIEDPSWIRFTPLGSADDAFRYRREVVFAALGDRRFDDALQPLPIPEPVLQIQRLVTARGRPAVTQTACQFVYAGELADPARR